MLKLKRIVIGVMVLLLTVSLVAMGCPPVVEDQPVVEQELTVGTTADLGAARWAYLASWC